MEYDPIIRKEELPFLYERINEEFAARLEKTARVSTSDIEILHPIDDFLKDAQRPSSLSNTAHEIARYGTVAGLMESMLGIFFVTAGAISNYEFLVKLGTGTIVGGTIVWCASMLVSSKCFDSKIDALGKKFHKK